MAFNDLNPVAVVAPNGDTFLIRPQYPALLQQALIKLEKKGIRLKAAEIEAGQGAALTRELLRLSCVSWTKKGEEVPQSQAELENLFDTREKVVAWISKTSRELADKIDTEFDEALGNSSESRES